MLKIGLIAYIDPGPGIGSGEFDVNGDFLDLGRWSVEKLSKILTIGW